MWEPFGSYLLNSTANPAHFHSNWAGLAVLFSRQLLNGSQDYFFRFNIIILVYFFKYKTIETHARAFLPLNISAVGSVPSQAPITCSFKHNNEGDGLTHCKNLGLFHSHLSQTNILCRPSMMEHPETCRTTQQLEQ